MIGTTLKNNDIHIFFEDEDIDNLLIGKVIGSYINLCNMYKPGRIISGVDNKLCEQKMELTYATASKTEDGLVHLLELAISDRAYAGLTERGSFEDHQGYRHIHLIDTARMKGNDKLFYLSLKS